MPYGYSWSEKWARGYTAGGGERERGPKHFGELSVEPRAGETGWIGMEGFGLSLCWVWWLAAVVGFFYVVCPLAVLGWGWVRGELELNPTLVEDLPESARDSLRRMLEALWAQGFEVVSNCRTPNSAPGVLGVQVLLVQPEARDIGYGIFSSAGNLRAWMVTIRTRFADGTQIVTSSSTAPGVYPVDPSVDAIHPYWIKDPARLYRIHRARVVASGRAGEPRMLPAPGQAIGYQQDEWREEVDRVIRAGYYRAADGEGRCRMTVKGAFVMTWRLLWPVKQIRQARRRVRAWWVIRGLGV
jgi:hypothetical protein